VPWRRYHPAHTDFNALQRQLVSLAADKRVKLTAKRMKLLQSALAERDERAEPVIKRIHKKEEPYPLYGLYEMKIEGKSVTIEYEPDADLRDTEQVPLLEIGGIEAFLWREVLPYAPDAWFDQDATRVGYEISFNRYFYEPQPLRSLDHIKEDILKLERETEGLLTEIVGGSV
jgi:type I restriction enzyme M protein